jgi:hypothetical protein
LTETQVLEIRQLRGIITQREIAQRYGIRENSVRNIQLGHTWAWLGEIDKNPKATRYKNMPRGAKHYLFKGNK